MTVKPESVLGDYLEFRNGRSPPERCASAKYRVFGSNGPIGWAAEYNAEPQAIIIGRVGSYCGSIHYSSAPCWVTDNAMVATPKKIEEGRFWYFVLAGANLNNYRAGSGQPLLNQTILSRIYISAPEHGTRLQIASILGALDDKIELNRRMNETLEAMARAIFKDWFVDFGPVRAKQEGRAPYLAPDIWSLFPDRLDDEGKPEGWDYGTLSAIANLNPESWGRNYPAEIQYVDLSNTKWGMIETVETHSSAGAPSRAQRILRPGDTIIGTVRPGNGSYAFVGTDGLTGSTGFAVLRPKEVHYRELVYYAATSVENIDRLAHLADGGAYPAVRPDVVIATSMPKFEIEMARSFSTATAALLDRAECNKSESKHLAALRDLLLPKLMSGEIRVKDAEKLVGQAA